MREKVSQLKIWQKLVLFAATPLFVQLVFGGLVWWQIQEYQREVATQQRAKAVVDCTNRTVNCIYQIVSDGVGLTDGSIDIAAAKRLLSDMQQLLSAREQLDESMSTLHLSKNDYDLSALDKFLSEFKALKVQLLSRSMIDRMQAIDALRSLQSQLPVTLSQSESGLRSVIAASDRIRAVDLEAVAAIEKRMQLFVAVGCIANIVLAVIFAQIFSRNIVRRIQIMAENTKRLPLGEALLEQVDGSDEIAEVDGVFHKMSEALRSAQRKERELLDNASEVIFALDSNYQISRINDAVVRRWGYSQEELIGVPFSSLIGDDSWRTLQTRFASSKNDGQTAFLVETPMQTSDGRHFDLAISVCWCEADNQFFCVAHDVTESKRTQELKQQFLMMLSHDLRAPLSSISVGQEALSEGVYGPISEEGKSQLEKSNANIARLVRLVSDLLDSEKLAAGEMRLRPTDTNISEIIGLSVDSVQAFAHERQISIAFQNTHAGTIHADAGRMEQVLVNLISNAIKFAPSGSTITIGVRDENDWVGVYVRDSGPGIPESDRTAIFDRFKQVSGRRGSHKGTGLGLAICKMIVEQHGGQIGVDCPPDGGSSFWFRLPKQSISPTDIRQQTALNT